MSADPAQITAARIQAIIDEWLEILAGAHGPLTTVGRFQDIETIEGAWTLDASGLWLEVASWGFTPIAALPFSVDAKAGSTGARIVGHAALLYTADPVAPPRAELVTAASTGVAIGTGTAQTAPASVGWHLVTWEAGTPLSIGANECALQRFVMGSVGDRVAAGVAVIEVL